MARDINDLWGWVQRLVRRVARLESGAMLENSSITNGRLRLIASVLRLDSGALLELIGQWRFFGNGAITGDVYSEGTWTQVGDYDFTGNGDLAGDVDMSGNFDLTGIFKSGNVRIEDGKIYVGTGASQIVIDGATGRIIAGTMTIDPSANGGAVKFAGGPEVYASGAQLSLYSGTGAFIELNGSMAKVNGPGARWIEVDSSGFRIVGMPTKTAAETGLPPGSVSADSSGYLYRIVT